MLCTFRQITHCVFQDINDIVWDEFSIKSTVRPISRMALQTSGQFEEITMETNIMGPLSLKTTNTLIFQIPSHLASATKRIYLQLMLRFPRSEVIRGKLIVALASSPSPLRFQAFRNQITVSVKMEDLESGDVWVSPNLIGLFPRGIPNTVRLSLQAEGMDKVDVMSLDSNLDGCLLPTLALIN